MAAATPQSPGLSAACDVRTDQPLPKVHIVLVPTADPTTVPAHLQLGQLERTVQRPSITSPPCAIGEIGYGRRAGRPGQGHVESSGCADDPPHASEAIELARLQYAYCNDIVDQGVNDLSALAAALMADDWWFFWWD